MKSSALENVLLFFKKPQFCAHYNKRFHSKCVIKLKSSTGGKVQEDVFQGLLYFFRLNTTEVCLHENIR